MLDELLELDDEELLEELDDVLLLDELDDDVLLEALDEVLDDDALDELLDELDELLLEEELLELGGGLGFLLSEQADMTSRLLIKKHHRNGLALRVNGR